jgi:hypothetical protein
MSKRIRRKAVTVNTAAQTGTENANLITPTNVNEPLPDELFKAMSNSLAWKPNQNDTGEKPHLLQRHLETNYEQTKLKEIFFGSIAKPKPKDYSLRTKLFLFGMCALFAGLPSKYQLNKFELVSNEEEVEQLQSQLKQKQRVSNRLEAASTCEQHAEPLMLARSHNVSDYRATRTDND